MTPYWQAHPRVAIVLSAPPGTDQIPQYRIKYSEIPHTVTNNQTTLFIQYMVLLLCCEMDASSQTTLKNQRTVLELHMLAVKQYIDGRNDMDIEPESTTRNHRQPQLLHSQFQVCLLLPSLGLKTPANRL